MEFLVEAAFGVLEMMLTSKAGFWTGVVLVIIAIGAGIYYIH